MSALLFSVLNKALLAGALFFLVALNPGCEKTTQSPPPAQVSKNSVTTPSQKETSPEISSASDAAEESKNRSVAIVAGGCFWGMEDLIRQIPGVLDTEVGYTGGEMSSPRYEQVKTGSTGHAEAVRVVFDPNRLAYADFLGWFFRMHDPTTMNRQGNDVGTQYRSTIFYTSESQRDVAEQVKKQVDASGKWKAPVVTSIVKAGPFTSAEDYHQDYLEKNPGGYTCHFLRDDTL